MSFQSGIQFGHITRMVFAVMDFHRSGINVGLEGVVSVGEIGKRVSHE